LEQKWSEKAKKEQKMEQKMEQKKSKKGAQLMQTIKKYAQKNRQNRY
jgi:hypothetical protein